MNKEQLEVELMKRGFKHIGSNKNKNTGAEVTTWERMHEGRPQVIEYELAQSLFARMLYERILQDIDNFFAEKRPGGKITITRKELEEGL